MHENDVDRHADYMPPWARLSCSPPAGGMRAVLQLEADGQEDGEFGAGRQGLGIGGERRGARFMRTVGRPKQREKDA